MHQPYLSPPHRTNKKVARALLPLLVWLAVALSLKYGNYGNHGLVLGSNSTRMVKTSSIFVKEINAKGIPTKKVLCIYGFSDKPKFGSATNRSTRYSMFFDSYGHKKFSMWLNKGSKISINWNVVVHGGASNGELLLALIKGDNHHNLKGLKRYDHLVSSGNNKVNYVVKEDNTYNIEIENLKPQRIEMDLNVSVSSTMYDTTKATSFCSLTNMTTCKLKLDFPRSHYFVFTTQSNEDDSDELEVVLTFTARIITYFFIFGIIMAVFWIIIKQVQGCQPTERTEEEEAVSENEPILATKEITCNYGTSEDPETSLSGSFTDIYDEKICILCYEQNKACFFTPCGHSISCFPCAQRIMKEDNRICPVCRRLIQKIRKLPGL